MKILDWLKMPETRDLSDLDDVSTTLLHSRIIRDKRYLRELYGDFYRQFKESLPGGRRETLVELGSGGGFIKEIIPGVITSDLAALPGVDRRFSVFEMPFADGEVDAFLLAGVLHHVKDAAAFFTEAARCLRPGGRLVMIEPAMTPWGRILYRVFHHEAVDLEGDWTLPRSGRLSAANLALPWIVFRRDAARFEKDFPFLDVVGVTPHTPLRYALSGGVTYRQVMPDFTHGFVRALEKLLRPLNGCIGMFTTIVCRKRG